jgi:hypothetical protein
MVPQIPQFAFFIFYFSFFIFHFPFVRLLPCINIRLQDHLVAVLNGIAHALGRVQVTASSRSSRAW